MRIAAAITFPNTYDALHCSTYINYPLANNALPDHEIFKLRDEVIAHDGPNVTFYSLLGVAPSATQDQLNKAWRKKSREEHPDKARTRFVANYHKLKSKKSKPGVKVSKSPSKREIDAYVKDQTVHYQRLSVIADILRGPQRERYDHFLKNGFPTWRGTGYYYARFRPGAGTVLVGLLVAVCGGVHYIILVMSYRQRRQFVEKYIRHARRVAFGDESGISGIPSLSNPASGTATPVPVSETRDRDSDEGMEDMQTLNRKQKRAMEKEKRLERNKKAVKPARKSGLSTPVEAEVTSGPQGAKKRIVAPNGKVLIVDSEGNVFLEEETEEGMRQEFLLDVSAPYLILMGWMKWMTARGDCGYGRWKEIC